jgi:hypothetical protein
MKKLTAISNLVGRWVLVNGVTVLVCLAGIGSSMLTTDGRRWKTRKRLGYFPGCVEDQKRLYLKRQGFDLESLDFFKMPQVMGGY